MPGTTARWKVLHFIAPSAPGRAVCLRAEVRNTAESQHRGGLLAALRLLRQLWTSRQLPGSLAEAEPRSMLGYASTAATERAVLFSQSSVMHLPPS